MVPFALLYRDGRLEAKNQAKQFQLFFLALGQYIYSGISLNKTANNEEPVQTVFLRGFFSYTQVPAQHLDLKNALVLLPQQPFPQAKIQIVEYTLPSCDKIYQIPEAKDPRATSFGYGKRSQI